MIAGPAPGRSALPVAAVPMEAKMPVPGVQGLHCAAGFSGMGFKIAPAVGLTMAELLLDGRGTTVDISLFDPGRFAAGRPIKAPHEYKDE